MRVYRGALSSHEMWRRHAALKQFKPFSMGLSMGE
jgi:hypothetical protein